MNLEVISIGNELLQGEIQDTNSHFIVQNIAPFGFNINYITVVGDNKKDLDKVLKNALKRSDIIITTGGLGPTDDDITRKSIATATGHKLKKRDKLEKDLENFFNKRNHKITENNYKQAYLPQGADPLNNEKGTAPGILLNLEDNTIISLPGVPEEMEHLLFKDVIPLLKNKQNESVETKYLNLIGIGESTLETEIKHILDQTQNPEISLLAEKGEVRIKITATANSSQKTKNMIENVENKIREAVGEYIYGINKQSLPEVVGKLLKDNDLMIGLAESCTGGLIGDRITNIPGSSSYFKGGIIAYSNKIKENILQVSSQTLKTKGAVSKQTAREMAKGIKENFNTDLGLAVTGIAGPGGGIEEKPVGLVYIGICDSNSQKVYKLNLNGSRSNNKWYTSQYALNYIRKWILKS